MQCLRAQVGAGHAAAQPVPREVLLQQSLIVLRIEDRLRQAGLPLSPPELRAADLSQLAREAQQQWTAQFNPIELDFEEIYRAVLAAG